MRKRVGKRFKVIRRFRTYKEALDYVCLLFEQYPGIYFDVKDVSVTHLDNGERIALGLSV